MTSADDQRATRGDECAGGVQLHPPTPLDDVCVQIVDLSTIEQSQHAMTGELEESERARASTFKQDLHRERFVARRWWRRQVIAQAAGVDPQSISIHHDRLGKPRIDAPASLRSTSISSSHHDGVALVAWSRSRTVGIDVAACDASHVTPEAARIFMTNHEYNDWSQCDSDDQAAHFYWLWTRKEAVLKALGTGFATDPHRVDVRHPQVVCESGLALHITDLVFRDGWACALAASD